MKALFFCGSIFAFLWSEVQSAALNQILLPLDAEQEQCIKELHLNRERMAYLSTQEFSPEDNPKFNNFFSCTWKKQNYQQLDGSLNFKALETMLIDVLEEQAGSDKSALKLAKELAFLAVNNCNYIRGNSHGQTAVQTQNCMYRTLLRLANEYKHLSRSTTNKLA